MSAAKTNLSRRISSARRIEDYNHLRRVRQEVEERVICAARKNVNAFVEYVGVYQQTKRAGGEMIRSWERVRQRNVHVDIQGLIDVYNMLMLLTYPGLGKTTQVALRFLWELGHDFNLRCIVVSKTGKTESPAGKLSRMIRDYAEDPRVRRVFPNLMKGRQWGSLVWSVYRVGENASKDDDPTMRVTSLFHSPTGGRANWIIIDDLYDMDNCTSEKDGEAILNWVVMALKSRLFDPDTCRIVWLTNAWHPKDPAHILLRDGKKATRRWPQFHVARFPAFDEQDNPLDERYTRADAAKIRQDYGSAAEPLYWLRPRNPKDKVFRDEVLREAFREDVPAVTSITRQQADEAGVWIVAAVDPGLERKKGADKCGVSVVAIDKITRKKRPLWVLSGQMNVDELALRILEINHRYQPHRFCVETVQAQRWLLKIVAMYLENQGLQARMRGEVYPYDLPTFYPYTTGMAVRDKHVGFEGLSLEMAAGQWLIPSPDRGGPCADGFLELYRAFDDYMPGQHIADIAMSIWLAKECSLTISEKRSDEDSLVVMLNVGGDAGEDYDDDI